MGYIILYIYVYIYIHGYNMYVYEFVWIFNVFVGSWTDVAPRTQRITAAGYPLPEPRDSWLQTHAAEVHRPFIRGCSARGIHPQLSPHIPMFSLISILISIQSELCTSPLFVFPTFQPQSFALRSRRHHCEVSVRACWVAVLSAHIPLLIITFIPTVIPCSSDLGISWLHCHVGYVCNFTDMWELS